VGAQEPRAYGYWAFVLRRLAHDRTAVASFAALVVILLAVFAGAPLAARLLGHGPDDPFPYAVDAGNNPAGPLSRVPDVHTNMHGGPPDRTTLLVLGADGTLGRDEMLRVLYGGRVSIEVAVGATAVSLLIGFVLGSLAGLAGGIVDAAIARLTELAMAFPLLLFLMLLGATVGDRLVSITLGGLVAPGVVSIALLIGAFTWFYPARIVRTEVLSLRQRDFIEAARMTGAGPWRILQGAARLDAPPGQPHAQDRTRRGQAQAVRPLRRAGASPQETCWRGGIGTP
jgi:ABC-type dipeptide/oligopeptide/nickel transport system permease subunit